MYSPKTHSSHRPMLIATLLLAIITISFSIVIADDTQDNAPATQPINPNAATQPSDLQIDKYGWTNTATECMARMRGLASVAWRYANNHNDHLPPNLGSVMNQFRNSHDAAESSLTPGDERLLNIPDHPTADWINHNTSFVYLAANLNLHRFPNTAFNTTVMMHTRLDQPFQHPKAGDVAILAFIDGHIELFPLAEARKIIESSKQKLAAATR
jgi:hypothetical protein